MTRPFVSVIIPTYQHGNVISQTIDSVFEQSYPLIEVIVVNDGSTDDTRQVLKAYEDRVVIVHQENAGSNPARNRGFKEAKGTFVLFLDADIKMHPQMIEKMVDALTANPEASYAYSGFRFGWKRFVGIEFDASRLKDTNFIHTSSLIRANDFPGFDESIKRLQDWDLWLTMLENGKKGVLVDEILFDVVIDGESRIGSSWLPSFAYRLPWRLIGWRPKQVEKYENAKQIIASKHHI